MGEKIDEKTNNKDEEMDSEDEALLSMLGLADMDLKVNDECGESNSNAEEEKDPNSSLANTNTNMANKNMDVIRSSSHLTQDYQRDGVCLFPTSLIQVSPTLIRRLTDELIWGGDSVQADKSFENIKVFKGGELLERRTLTRLENFVEHHDGWKELCHGYIQNCLSALVGQEMVLFKEKLNLKPPGGSGFAPHLDGPSLRVALGDEGPKTFVTVMVAIDNMTAQNGSLRVAKGPWSEENHIQVIEPEKDGNPDAGGRAGAIPANVAASIEFEDLICKGGSIAAFSEWTPHRSAANTSPFPRRAVFLTYNPASEGNHRAKYYQKMEDMRNEWRSQIGLANRSQWEEDNQRDMEALSTVPT